MSLITDCWGTDPQVFAWLQESWPFDVDVAAFEGNSLCPKHFRDSFAEPNWSAHGRRFYANGEYSCQERWFKLCYERARDEGVFVCMLVPLSQGGTYWNDYVIGKADTVIFVGGRMRFVNPLTQELAPNHFPLGSAFVIYEPGAKPRYGATIMREVRWIDIKKGEALPPHLL